MVTNRSNDNLYDQNPHSDGDEYSPEEVIELEKIPHFSLCPQRMSKDGSLTPLWV